MPSSRDSPSSSSTSTTRSGSASAVEALDGAIDIGSEPPERKSLVLDIIRC